MNIGLRQNLSQQQKLIITPKLRQAIEVLLMSRLDLQQHLSQQLEQNPLLEEDLEAAEGEPKELEELDPDTQWNEPEESVDREDKAPDIEWENCFDDMLNPSERAEFEHWENEDHPQSDVAERRSLQDYLLEQLSLGPFSDQEREIGEQIIGNLDDNGQLKVTPLFEVDLEFMEDLNRGVLPEKLRKRIEKGLQKELQSGEISLSESAAVRLETPDAKWVIVDTENQQEFTVKFEDGKLNFYYITLEDIADRVGCNVEEVEQVLYYIQRKFDPIGIAFRTIPETLLIQMKAAEVDHPLAEKIVRDHFDELLNVNFRQIAKKLGVSIGEIQEVWELIHDFDPYPGRHFSDPTEVNPQTAQTIIPDVAIEKVDGKYRVITNDDGMPKLRLNPVYVEWMTNSNKNLSEKDKEWLEHQRTQALDLISSIIQRRQTIAKVTEAIFEVQADFLERGLEGLKPLVLKQIADMAGVHESTVSRVTSNKYVETPQGIYRLKDFFSGSLETDSGDDVSTTTVKEKIKEMIEKEDVAKPLSDQVISRTLNKMGIRAARRTVAKYREELGILPSSKRKRQW
jgi:RNA polymerase sigma-54 factor